MKVLAITLLFATLLVSCESSFDQVKECVEDKIELFDMEEYTNQEIGCKFYLIEYEYLEENYYSVGSHCADMQFNLTDCSGNSICENQESAWCVAFFEHSTDNGIVAISK